MSTDIQRTIKYVWVTYDPLYEQVVCVHENHDSQCKKCKALRNKRWKSKSSYMPDMFKLKLQK